MDSLFCAPTVLLVDDDPGVRASLHFSLGLEGFQVEAFEAGEALLEKQCFPTQACLVLDYRLPGIDGLMALKKLRERGIALPAVIITSNPTRRVRQRAMEAGATLIEKPLLSDSLSDCIHSLVNDLGAANRPSGLAG